VGGAPRLPAHTATRPAALLFAILIAAGRVDARTGGINGASGKQGSTCAECHLGGTRPDVAFAIADAVHAGETVAVRFTVHAGSPAAKAAGFNVAVEGGTLVALPGHGAHLSNGEITHNEPLDNDAAHDAGWDFEWIAPKTPGRYRLWGAGNSVNLNGQPTGDKSNATVLRVDVLAAADTPTPTATQPPATATPPATVTATPPPTDTPRPTASATASATASTTATVPPSLTATSAATATPPPIDTASPTASAAPTGTASVSDTASPTATDSPSPTAAASASPSPTDTPTASPTPPTVIVDCPGDCNGDRTVTINELVTAVAIALDVQPLTACPSADRDGDQRLAINELVSMVNSVLAQC
jgi:hypothetical protein